MLGQIKVLAPDRNDLLKDICVTLSAAGLSVVNANIITENDIIHNEFHVVSRNSNGQIPEEQWDNIKEECLCECLLRIIVLYSFGWTSPLIKSVQFLCRCLLIALHWELARIRRQNRLRRDGSKNLEGYQSLYHVQLVDASQKPCTLSTTVSMLQD